MKGSIQEKFSPKPIPNLRHHMRNTKSPKIVSMNEMIHSRSTINKPDEEMTVTYSQDLQ